MHGAMRTKAGRPDPDREGFSEEIISYDDWLKKKIGYLA